MNKDKYVFAQLIEFLDNNKFRHLVDKYDGNRYVKHFTCWNHYRIFEDFAFYMMEQARKKRVTDVCKLKGNVYAFDSTTIPLCLSVFWWAKFRKKKGGVKAHVLYDLES